MRTLYLTFDVDWAPDDVLEDTVHLLEEHDARATFLITHSTPILNRLRRQPDRFELGIHPDFNALLTLKDIDTDCEGIVRRLKAIVPEAQCARSHSMTQGSLIWNAFAGNGIRYDLNTLIPYHSGIEAKPLSTNSGIVRVPYCWEDDDHMEERLSWDPDPLLSTGGLLVLDFHPIHVFLNAESTDRYLRAKALSHDTAALAQMANRNTPGCRSFLLGLLGSRDISFGLIREICFS